MSDICKHGYERGRPDNPCPACGQDRLVAAISDKIQRWQYTEGWNAAIEAAVKIANTLRGEYDDVPTIGDYERWHAATIAVHIANLRKQPPATEAT